MGQLRVEVLGRPAIRHGGTRLTLGAKTTALLCYLAVTGERHPRGALAGLLWGELPDDRARANLRMVLSELRRTLGGHVDITGREVGPGRHWQVDLAELGAALAHPDGDAPARLRALARGELLAGLDIAGAPGFDAWLVAERERVRRMTTDGLTGLAHAAAAHDPEQALAVGRELLALDPIDESAHRLVMQLLVATGRRAAALAQYETCRLVLADELGVDPSPETVAVRDRLLREDGVPARQPAARPVDDGDDVAGPQATRPDHLDRSAVTPSGARAARVLHHLPLAADPLLGRDTELDRIQTLLADRACRLLTLVGPGGVGKTRLAMAAADALAGDFADGVAFVPLAALPAGASGAAVAGGVAQALDVPPWRDSPREALRRALAGRRLLVVLDNVEHLHVGDLIADLLASAPGLTLLATSRRRTGLGAEWLLDVGGLAYPDRAGADLERFPAVALFAARARRVRPTFTVADDPEAVLWICRLVEGLPLALELAADWLRTLRPREVADLIAADLDALATDHAVVEDRQRSMRSVLDASWRLLDADQHRMLARLSVFRGGFDAGAARAVAGASARDLARLVDRCVVQARDGGRFDLHELLRHFAAERLREDPEEEAEARSRHAGHFAEFAATHDLRDDDTAAALEADLANLRTAVRWLTVHGDEDRLAACLACLWRLDRHKGRFAETLAMLERALARPEVSPARAAAWHRWTGAAAFQLGRMDRALEELETAFSVLDQPLPRRSAAVGVAIVREAVRQGAHRLLPGRSAAGGDGGAERIEALSLLQNLMYFLQRPLPMALFALLAVNTADRSDDPGAASCAYAELGHGLAMRGWHGLADRYGALADACAARAGSSPLVYAGLETRAMSHLAVADWVAVDAQIARATAAATGSVAGHRLLTWQALSGVSALFRGRFAQALEAFAGALDASRTVGDELAFVWCANGVTDATLGLGGDLPAVRDLQAEAVERSSALPAPERLKSLSVAAALRLAEGRTDEVLAAARAGDSTMRDVRFFPVWALDAYSHLAQVWLALWDQAGEPVPELARGARAACRQLARFARAYPVATPRSRWADGWLAWLERRPRRAAAAWQRSLAAAERLRMPYDQARAHVALASSGAAGPVADEHRARVRELVTELGARPALLGLRPEARPD